MRTLIIGSTHKGSGKTGLIVGLAAAWGKKAGYMKPFGDRLIYHKKRLWDYDSAFMTRLWNLQENPEDISIGFEHAKLKYKYDAAATVEKLKELSSHCGSSKDLLFVEGGSHLGYGGSVNLDAVSVAKALGGELIIVVSGSEGTVADDLVSLKKSLDLQGVKFKGVVVNKIHDPEDFKTVYLPAINALGIPVLGLIPYKKELEHFSMQYLSEILFSKTLAGEGGLKNQVAHIVIGAMSVGSTLRETLFTKEKKLVVTSGDRTDMILAALEEGTSGVILTNNILPPPNVISRAAEKNIPLLLVTTDTFKTAKQLDELEPLLTKGDPEKVALFTSLVKEHVDLNKL